MLQLELEINPETAADAADIEALLDSVLGRKRLARGVYRLRSRTALDLGMSFTCRANRSLIASLRFWPVPGALQRRLLGPLAVRHDYQCFGVGTALALAGLRAADAAGVTEVFVVGDPAFYRRFGFRMAGSDIRWIPEPVDRNRIMVLDLLQERPAVFSAQKVWVRRRPATFVSGLRATNSRRPVRGRGSTQAMAA